MYRLVAGVVAIIIAYFTFLSLQDYMPQQQLRDAMTEQLQTLADEFCQCTKSDKQCQRQSIEKIEKINKNFIEIDKKGPKASEYQRKRMQQIIEQIRACAAA